MKAGDLVRYLSDIDGDDEALGVIASIAPGDSPPWAEVVWSLRHGPHYDEVPLKDLEIVNESR
jgi:hypothetical protein